MRATVMRTCQLLLLLTVFGPRAVHAQLPAPQPAPVRNTYMRSWLDFLPPILEEEENLSLYTAYEANGGPGLQSFSRFGATQFLPINDGVFSLNGEGFVTDTGHGGASASLHMRQLIGSGMWGSGVSWTGQESNADNVYEQVGFHVEIFPNELWSVRLNGYVPIGNDLREIANGGPLAQPAIFSQNNIVIPTLTAIRQEGALEGAEFELARQISSLAMEGYGSVYKYKAFAGRDAEGGKAGLRGYVTQRLQGHVAVSSDNRFGTQVYGGVTLYWGGGAGVAPQTMRDKLRIPVERNHQIIVQEVAEFIPGSIIATNGGVPITVSHVRNGAFGGNNGTFENPFNTNMLPATQPTDIVYVHGGAAPYLNGYTLAPGQRLLGEGAGNPHMVNTDQFGQILLGAGSGSFSRAPIQGTIIASNGSEISNLNLQPSTTGIELPMLLADVNVNRSTINGGINGGAVGVDITGGSGTFTFGDVDILDTSVAGLRVTGGSSDIVYGTVQPALPLLPMFTPSTIVQNDLGTAVTVAGGHSGSLLTNAGSTISATNGTGLQFDNADGTYTFDGAVTLNGGDAGIDILGGSDGIFTFADADITNPTGPAIQIGTPGDAASGGAANVTFAALSSLTQNNNVPAVQVLGNHTGSLTHVGPLTASNGSGLQFGEAATGANGTYTFSGVTTLAGADAGIDILGASSGTFTFANASITSPTGTAVNIDGLGGTSTTTLNYTDGAIIQTNNVATVNVRNHATGVVTVGADITATNGTGLQFNNADGTYNFTGLTMLNGGDVGIDIVMDSDGTFSFRRPMITNLSGGIGVNVDGGAAAVTLDGGSITTNGGTGLNINNNSGLVTVLQPTDITSSNARAVDINSAQVNILLRNVISDGSPFEGIDIDSVLAGSSFTINGVARVLNAGGNGIDIANSDGAFSVANTDIDVTGGHGVRLDTNVGGTSVLFSGGGIDGTTLDGFFVNNTNDLTINGILFGFATPIAGDAIDYNSVDGQVRNLTVSNNLSTGTGSVGGRGIAIAQALGRLNAVVTNNTLSSTGQTFVTSDGGLTGSLILQVDDNSWITALPDFASDIVGSGTNSTIVTSYNNNTSRGFGGGGMLFDRVTFDATGELLAGVQASGLGVTTVTAGGDGLSFINPTGDLSLTEVAITNFNGTGLEVFTKGLATTFNLQVGNSAVSPAGSISTTGGPAIFLDPLTGNISIRTVASTNSAVGGAPIANSSSTGDGIFVDEFTATGGPATNALRIETLNVSGAGRFGARIQDSQGQFQIGMANINGTAMDAVSLDNNTDSATRVTISGGTISNLPAMVDGIHSVNTSVTVDSVAFGNIIVDPMGMAPDVGQPVGGDAVDIRQTDGINRTHFITNNTSELFEDPMAMVDVALIQGRAINIQTDPLATGAISATISDNNLQSVESALRVRTDMNMNTNIASLDISGNTFQTTGMMVPPLPTVDLLGFALGGNMNSLRVSGFNGNTVTGNGVTGGVRIARTTFQPLAGATVTGGATVIGTDAARVVGDGLALVDVSGALDFSSLNIANQDGVGLLVVTKGPPATTFSLFVNDPAVPPMMPVPPVPGGGTIDTVGGPAMFLDPVNININLDAVTSEASLVGPGISTGDGITLQDVTGVLRIANTQITNAGGEGIHISQAAGTGSLDVELAAVNIDTTIGDGVLIDDMGMNSTRVTIGIAEMGMMIPGSTINATGGDGIDVNGVGGLGSLFTLNSTTFTNLTGFTGTIMNSNLNGTLNVDDNFNANPANAGNTGSILFTGGMGPLQ